MFLFYYLWISDFGSWTFHRPLSNSSLPKVPIIILANSICRIPPASSSPGRLSKSSAASEMITRPLHYCNSTPSSSAPSPSLSPQDRRWSRAKGGMSATILARKPRVSPLIYLFLSPFRQLLFQTRQKLGWWCRIAAIANTKHIAKDLTKKTYSLIVLN